MSEVVRGPDVAFISKERLSPGEVPTGFWPLAPDLAVEVLSPSDGEDVAPGLRLEVADIFGR